MTTTTLTMTSKGTSPSTVPMRVFVELKVPEGSSYNDIIAMLTRAISALPGADMPPAPTPGASMTVRDASYAPYGLIHLVPK